MRALALLVATLVACVSPDPDLRSGDAPQGRTPPPEPRIVDATSRPAPGPYPKPPGIDRPEGEAPPERVRLARDAAVVGRMSAEGLVARFDFEAREGELSLFSLTAWGYARGWTSDSTMVVRDSKGAELARSYRIGGTVYDDMLPFVAPADGEFVLELAVVKHGFRYLVIRHSGYAPHGENDVHVVGDADLAHEWISGRTETVAFRVTGVPGEEVVVRAEPTVERGRNQKRALRRRLAAAHAGLVAPGRMAARMGDRGRDDGSFPDLKVTVTGAAEPWVRGHAAIVRVPESGSFDVLVRRTDDGPPGLFDLTLERAPEFTEFDVRVGDEDDDPVEGAAVALMIEPTMDVVAEGTTGADGRARVRVPAGDYTVIYRAPRAAPQTVRTRVEGAEINLVVERGKPAREAPARR